MTSSTISQPLNNAALPAQTGGFVIKQPVNFTGGDALIGFSASAWSGQPGPISMSLWLDGQPTGAMLGTYASQGAMHLSLGHTWAWVHGLTPGQHVIMLETGPATVTDPNDVVCLTVIEPNDGLAIRLAEDAPCPTGVAQPLITARAETKGGGVWISGSSSGWVTQAATTVRSALLYDGGDGAPMEVFANNANQRLTVVPTDNVEDTSRGNHEFQVFGGGQTQTDPNDYAHLSVVEWVDYAQAPSYLAGITNAAAQAQQGSGTIASVPVTSKGGTLLVKGAASCWTQTANAPLVMSVVIDSTPVGMLRIFANPTSVHMAAVTNDLVVPNIPAGSHTLSLVGQPNTITDQNDRVSAFVMEFPKS
ncbi:MAG TPA: hypothetical protein VF517_13575 [Thermoleophilaceae bacterium]|jgi:hypothetical protein